MMIAQLCDYTKNHCELFTLNVQYVDYISIKLLLKKHITFAKIFKCYLCMDICSVGFFFNIYDYFRGESYRIYLGRANSGQCHG